MAEAPGHLWSGLEERWGGWGASLRVHARIVGERVPRQWDARIVGDCGGEGANLALLREATEKKMLLTYGNFP